MGDEQVQPWLAAYLQGDVQAFASLVEHFRRPLYAFIYRMCRDHHQAEDVFQEVWYKVIQHAHTYKEKKFTSWIFRIAHNLMIDHARKAKPQSALDAPDDQGHTLHDLVAAKGLSPASLAAADDLHVRIDQALALLPGEQREVFLLRTEGDVSFKEIAVMQGTSINTALARMHYALQKLREELASDYEALAGGLS